MLPASSDFRQRDLGDVDRPDAERDDVPDDEHGQERARAEDDAEAVGDVTPVAAALDVSDLEPRSRDPREQCGRDDERDRVHPIGEIRPLDAEDDAADDRPDHPGQVLDRLQQRRCRKLLVVDEVRHPGVDGRPEEAGRDALDSGEHDDHRRAADERERAEDGRAHEVGDDQQPPPVEPVDERRRQDPDQDDRQEVGDQERAHPLARAGAVEDVDGQRDGGNVPAPEPALRGRGAEVGREAEDGEAEDARTLTAARQKPAYFIRRESRRANARNSEPRRPAPARKRADPPRPAATDDDDVERQRHLHRLPRLLHRELQRDPERRVRGATRGRRSLPAAAP